MNGRALIADCHALMGMFAFVFLVYCWVEHNRKEFELQKNLSFLVFLTLLIACMGFGEQIIFSTAEGIQKYIGNNGKMMDDYVAAMAQLNVEGSFSDFIVAEIVGFLLPVTRIVLWLVMQIMDILQTVMLWMGLALSPLMLAFLAHPVTRGISTRFCTSIFSVMLWPIGFLIAEMSFLLVLKTMVKSGVNELAMVGNLATDIPSVALAPFVAVAVIVATVFLIVMYVIAPLLITVLLNGASPASMLGAAAGSMALGSSKVLGMTSSATSMVGSSMSRTAQATTSTARKAGGMVGSAASMAGKGAVMAGKGAAWAAKTAAQPLLSPAGGAKAGLSAGEVKTLKQQLSGHGKK